MLDSSTDFVRVMRFGCVLFDDMGFAQVVFETTFPPVTMLRILSIPVN